MIKCISRFRLILKSTQISQPYDVDRLLVLQDSSLFFRLFFAPDIIASNFRYAQIFTVYILSGAMGLSHSECFLWVKLSEPPLLSSSSLSCPCHPSIGKVIRRELAHRLHSKLIVGTSQMQWTPTRLSSSYPANSPSMPPKTKENSLCCVPMVETWDVCCWSTTPSPAASRQQHNHNNPH